MKERIDPRHKNYSELHGYKLQGYIDRKHARGRRSYGFEHGYEQFINGMIDAIDNTLPVGEGFDPTSE